MDGNHSKRFLTSVFIPVLICILCLIAALVLQHKSNSALLGASHSVESSRILSQAENERGEAD